MKAVKMQEENINKIDLIDFIIHIILGPVMRLFLIRMRIFARLENHFTYTFIVRRNDWLRAKREVERNYYR